MDTPVLDIEWLNIKRFFEGSFATEDATLERKIRRRSAKFFIQNSELYRRSPSGKGRRVVLSITELNQLIESAHNGQSHFGAYTTYAFLEPSYYWPSMYSDVSCYVSKCELCQLNSSKKTIIEKGKSGVGDLFDRFSVGFVGPLPITKRNNKYLIVAVENLSG